MNKLCLFVLIIVYLMVPTFQEVYANETIKIIVNGEELILDAEPLLVNDTILVPIRPIFESLGMRLIWENERGVVTTTTAIGEVKIRIGSDIAVLGDGTVNLMPTYPRIVNGRTMVPIRFVAETMKADVNWSEGTRTVSIITN